MSLHAPDDALRNELVKVSKRMPLADILAAADDYFEASGRRLTFEYVLLAGKNDQPDHARRLVTLLRGRTALVNVIPYNPVAGLPLRHAIGGGRRPVYRDLAHRRAKRLRPRAPKETASTRPVANSAARIDCRWNRAVYSSRSPRRKSEPSSILVRSVSEGRLRDRQTTKRRVRRFRR